MDLNAAKGAEESPCEIMCKDEQAAIKACILSIQTQREAVESSPDSQDSSAQPECLLPAVAAWTTCCAAANAEADAEEEKEVSS